MSNLIEYLTSLDIKIKEEKEKNVKKYKLECAKNKEKISQKKIDKIEKEIDSEYQEKLDAKNKIINLAEEIKIIPEDIEKLKITEYMLYRVDIIRAEKIIKKAIKSLGNIYEEIQGEIEDLIEEFEELDNIKAIDYSEYSIKGNRLAEAKEKYKLEYTEEERMAFIQEQLDIVDKAIHFNTSPIPHEILKNFNRDVQSKLPKFSNARQKRIKILQTMKEDYKKLLDPREILSIIEDAIENLNSVQGILTSREYKSVNRKLNIRKKIVLRSTKDINEILKTKEKKTGIINFNMQEARYQRMETLRNIILDATSLINANKTYNSEVRLEELKSSYEREKQFASVIKNLGSEENAEQQEKLKILETKINEIQNNINISKNIIAEQEKRIKNAKEELIILWKIEIDSVLSKQKEENLELPAPRIHEEFVKETEEIESTKDNFSYGKSLFNKLKKVQRGKHAST